MITDAQNRPSNSQSLAGAAATTVSTDMIDLLTANRNVGRSIPMRGVVHATEAFAGGTSVKVEMITSASSNGSSPTVIGTGDTITDANAPLGTKLFDKPIPGTAQRYLGFQYTTVGTHTTGKVTAHIVAETDNMPYPAMNTGL